VLLHILFFLSIHFCGLSGSGKTTLVQNTMRILQANCIPVEIIDGDEYRKALYANLGYIKVDRNTNIRRLAFVAKPVSPCRVLCVY
jgi:adenylylsulfate kinase